MLPTGGDVSCEHKVRPHHDWQHPKPVTNRLHLCSRPGFRGQLSSAPSVPRAALAPAASHARQQAVSAEGVDEIKGHAIAWRGQCARILGKVKAAQHDIHHLWQSRSWKVQTRDSHLAPMPLGGLQGPSG